MCTVRLLGSTVSSCSTSHSCVLIAQHAESYPAAKDETSSLHSFISRCLVLGEVDMFSSSHAHAVYTESQIFIQIQSWGVKPYVCFPSNKRASADAPLAPLVRCLWSSAIWYANDNRTAFVQAKIIAQYLCTPPRTMLCSWWCLLFRMNYSLVLWAEVKKYTFYIAANIFFSGKLKHLEECWKSHFNSSYLLSTPLQ